jgi:hypothetical protein
MPLEALTGPEGSRMFFSLIKILYDRLFSEHKTMHTLINEFAPHQPAYRYITEKIYTIMPTIYTQNDNIYCSENSDCKYEVIQRSWRECYWKIQRLFHSLGFILHLSQIWRQVGLLSHIRLHISWLQGLPMK